MILYNLKKSISNKPGFTLIELMVVITIIMIITISLFEPYQYYQNKIKLKVASKDISQSLYDARNMAINGISSGSNSSVGLYLDNSAGNKISFYSYNYTKLGSSITSSDYNINLIKEINLEKGIQIDSISGSTLKTDGLFFFNAISGSGEVYSFSGGKVSNFASKIKIDISYMGSSSPGLQQTLYYYTKTNIVDDN